MPTRINLKELTAFLINAHRNGYAADDKGKWIKESDGSTSIYYEDGSWKFHDNFFGSDPFGGREVVFFESKPVWMMVYYGEVFGKTKPNKIWNFLCSALRVSFSVPNEPFSLRGPEYLHKKSLCYFFKLAGDVKSFYGNERIKRYLSNHVIYRAEFVGGLVDKR